MFTVKATCHNGQINLLEPLPQELEGKEVSVIIQALEKPQKKTQGKRRQRGSAKGKIWLAPDFDEPLEDF